MFQPIHIPLSHVQSFPSLIIGSTPHQVCYFNDLRIFLLYTHHFADSLKVNRIPHPAHQSPCLKEFIFFHLMPSKIFRNILEIGVQPIFQTLFPPVYLLLFLFLQITFESLLPIFHHPFPKFIIAILFLLIPELAFIKGTTKPHCLVFVRYLLKQSLPSVFPPGYRPFQRLLHSILLRLAFLQVILFLFQIQMNELAHHVIKDTGTHFISQHLYLYHRIIHDRQQIRVQRFIIRITALTGCHILIQHPDIKGSVIFRIHHRTAIYVHPHVPKLFPYAPEPHTSPPLFYLLRI